MAQKTRTLTEYTDDIENKPFAEGEGETLTFSFDGKSYEIDLNTKNAEKMRKAMQFYVDHAQPATLASNSTATARRRGKTSGAGATRDYDLADLRVWAASNKIELPSRGRIKSDIIERYKAARG